MPLGIYVHIPFCLSKCPYCDFNSIVYDSSLAQEYVSSLLKEIRLFSKVQTQRIEADTIYFGGGTPSILKSSQLDSILEALFSSFQIRESSEISLEANPGTLIEEGIKEIMGLGINRVSLGIQSLADEGLKALGRVHTRDQAIKSYQLLRGYFENISLDLIFGIPGQTLKSWKRSLTTVVKLKPEHLSVYCLTVEEGTPFYRLRKDKKLNLPDEEGTRKMYLGAIELLKSQGYTHYELSNFARVGRECRHNLKYWRGEEYIGFGAGAHSYLDGVRRGNIKKVNDYIKRCKEGVSIIDFKERLTLSQKINEFILLGLRRIEGFDLKRLKEDLGFDLEKEKKKEIRYLIDKNFLKKEKNVLKLTRKGILVADSVMEKLIP
jgi:oxygen-independent coproporphyrinogen-3 oxidase